MKASEHARVWEKAASLMEKRIGADPTGQIATVMWAFALDMCIGYETLAKEQEEQHG